jgi:hypothetical protein
MKELIKAIEIIKNSFEKKGYVIKNCIDRPFHGDIRLTLTHGKIDFTKASDNIGVTETVKL